MNSVSIPSSSYPKDLLTPRELRIFLAHAHWPTVGLPYKRMAKHFALPLDTVKHDVKQIHRKLNVQNRGKLTYLACLWVLAGKWQGEESDDEA